MIQSTFGRVFVVFMKINNKQSLKIWTLCSGLGNAFVFSELFSECFLVKSIPF